MGMINQLRSGNVGGTENIQITIKSTKLLGKLIKISEEFTATLNDEQKKLHEKLVAIMEEQSYEERCRIYEYAFSLGLGLGYESSKII